MNTVVHGAPLDTGRNVLSLLQDQVAIGPGEPALREGDVALSRLELLTSVEHYARYLSSCGVRPGDVVLVEVPRSWQEVVTTLAVLRCGAAYTAIDTAAPKPRAARLVTSCRPAFVIGTTARADDLGGLAECPLLAPPGDPAVVASTPTGQLPSLPPDPDATACLYFTSGSTGQPKAVAIPHRAMARLVTGAHTYAACGAGERFMRLAPLAFDASTFEIFVPLATGAALEVFPAGRIDVSELAVFLSSRDVSVAFLTAGLFRVVAENAPSAFDSIKQLLTGGEVVSADHVRQILDRRSGSTFSVTNCYGPTENSTITTIHTMRHPENASGALPIGVPVPGCSVMVVDHHLEAVPLGEIGELLISGPGLATGYLHEPGLTAQSFVEHPTTHELVYRSGDLVQWADGALHFVGRADRQIKVRGHRVELAEIEAELRRHPSVQDAVVTLAEGTTTGQLIGGYVVSDLGGVDGNTLRASLHETLPNYMVPAALFELDSLPLTNNGKTDLAMVAELAHRGVGEGVWPDPAVKSEIGESDVADRIASCWSGALGHSDFDLDEGFFDVGGDSLTATTLLGDLRLEFPTVKIRIVDIFNYPSVSSFAAFVIEEMERSAPAS